MIYAFLAAFVFGLMTGGTAIYQIEKATVQRLEFAIVEANTKAEQELHAAQEKVKNAEILAANLRDTIEAEHAENIKQVGALNARVVAAGRLFNSRKNCQNTVSKSDSTDITDSQAARTDFPTGLAEIVRRADETAVYAQSCWKFVVNNCGVQNVDNSGK